MIRGTFDQETDERDIEKETVESTQESNPLRFRLCSGFSRWNSRIVAGAHVQFRHITDQRFIRHLLIRTVDDSLNSNQIESTSSES